MTTKTTLNNSEVEALLENIAATMQARMDNRTTEEPIIIGIHGGGYWVAEWLHQRLHMSKPLCGLSTQFHRDDYQHKGIPEQAYSTSITTDINHQHIILVDDVLHTGRSVRAAMNEIFDYGRPKNICLVVLADRKSGRQLPIAADFSGYQTTHHCQLRRDENKQFQMDVITQELM